MNKMKKCKKNYYIIELLFNCIISILNDNLIIYKHAELCTKYFIYV